MSDYLNERELQLTKYLFSLYKDIADYFNEIEKELKLNDEETYMAKKIFAERIYKVFVGEELSTIINHNKEIVEQNEQLQYALIETNKKLDDIQAMLEDSCDNCLVNYEECAIKCKRHITFKDILANIDELRGLNRDNDDRR